MGRAASKLQDYLKDRVQKSGGQYRKVRWEGRSGCPDCFIWWDWPKAAFVEVKAEGDRHSVLQRREEARMQQYGVPVYTARTMEEIDIIVKKVLATPVCMCQ
jgi:hypothetical protein